MTPPDHASELKDLPADREHRGGRRSFVPNAPRAGAPAARVGFLLTTRCPRAWARRARDDHFRHQANNCLYWWLYDPCVPRRAAGRRPIAVNGSRRARRRCRPPQGTAHETDADLRLCNAQWFLTITHRDTPASAPSSAPVESHQRSTDPNPEFYPDGSRALQRERYDSCAQVLLPGYAFAARWIHRNGRTAVVAAPHAAQPEAAHRRLA